MVTRSGDQWSWSRDLVLVSSFFKGLDNNKSALYTVDQRANEGPIACSLGRAGKNLRFFKKVFRFFRFLGFNVRTVARGAIDTRIRSRKKLYIRRLTHALLCKTLQIQ